MAEGTEREQDPSKFAPKHPLASLVLSEWKLCKGQGKKKKFKKSVIHELRLMLEHGTKPAAGMTEHRPSRAPVQLPARRDGR